jgi:hypothetical protein
LHGAALGDLSGFSPYRRPPMTEAKQQTIAESEHPLHTYIVEAVVSGHFRQQLGDEFSFDELQRQLTKDGYGAQAKNAKEVGAAIKLAGATQVRRNLGGQRSRRYALPKNEDTAETRDLDFWVSESSVGTLVHPVLREKSQNSLANRETGSDAGARSLKASRSLF